MKAKITKRLVDTLKPGSADVSMFDTELPGFVLRVRKTGGMSYSVEYKAESGRGATTQRVTIGPVGRMTPEEARAAAKKKLAEVGQGGNPAADKRRERGALPLSDVIDTFLRDHVEAKRKPSTAVWMRDTLERIV
jgi:Arm DNA-binding domain